MPPRFAYWTILIDGKPTAFRAHEQEELLPTVNQLKRKNKDVVLRWFSQGQLWDSPDAARVARQRPQYAPEKRNADWRPGGSHKDPRDRFKKKNRPERAWSDKEPPPASGKPWGGRSAGPPRGDRPWQNKPAGTGERDREARRSSSEPRTSGSGWSGKPSGPPRGDRKPWQGKPPASGKPWGGRPTGPRNKRDDEPPDQK